MYLNVNLASNASGAEGSCTTPRTPEILNLLSGAPFDNIGSYHPASYHPHNSSGTSGLQLSSAGNAAASTPGDGPSSPGEPASFSSSFSSLSSPPGTPSTPTGPPSLQNTRTYLIKEGLKLTIQSKRLASGRGSFPADNPHCYSPYKDELTTEDEERRRRRRERNKVAATKCRNRKKERTGILMLESDALEDQNSSFRSEIQRLENEKRRLMDVLAMHSPNCLKTTGVETPTSCVDYISNPLETNEQSGQYSNMSGLSSSNYGSVFECRAASSGDGSGMAGSASGSHNNSNYDLSPCNNFGSNTGPESSSSSYQANINHQSYR